MSDIRKRTGPKGDTWQVRYRSAATKTGYSWKTFRTYKAALAFRETSGLLVDLGPASRKPLSVGDAMDEWLEICKMEGLNGREPITNYSHENYLYRATFVKKYDWPGNIHELKAPDVVEFRSWLLRSGISRDLARKVLFVFQSMMKEMSVRGRIPTNCAFGISVRDDSRYDEPVVIPSTSEIKALLRAGDDLSNATNQTVAKPWKRYRPMLYLAVDSGMRPQEYIAAAKSALEPRGIRVERAVEGDGRKISVTKTPAGRRFIDLSAGTLDMVRHYAEKVALPNDYDLIFPDKSGGWQSRRNWQRRGFNVACEKAGLMIEEETEDGDKIEVPKYRPYDLRHFFASHHIAKKTNLKKLQKMMGHTNIETTLNVYGHLLDGDEAAQYGLLDDVL